MQKIKAFLALYMTKDFALQQFKDNLYGVSLYCKKTADVLALFFVVRFLSVYEYGLYSSYVAIAGWFLLPTVMGYGEYILVSENKDRAKTAAKCALFIIMACGLLVAECGFVAVYPIEMKLIFTLVLLRLFFEGITGVLILPYCQAVNKFHLISTVNMVYSAGMVVCAALTYIMGWGLAAFLTMLIGLGAAGFVILSVVAGINYIDALRHFKSNIKTVDRKIVPYIASYILGFLSGQVPILFVAMTAPREQAALFFAALAVVSVLHIIFAARVAKMTPEFMGEDWAESKARIKRNILFLGTATVGFLLMILIIGKWLILMFYGKEYYLQALPLIYIWIGATFFAVISNPLYAYLTARGKMQNIVKVRIGEIIACTLLVFALYFGCGISAVYAAIWGLVVYMLLEALGYGGYILFRK